MNRNDISIAYRVVKDTTTFYLSIWEDPRPTDTSFRQDILDSMAKLRSQGYTLYQQGGYRIDYVECSDCDELNRKKPSAKATCGERD